MDSLW